jgi:histidine triad (HIT) family protein
MPENCLFCKIVRGEIPAVKLYEDEEVVAFRDIAPQAPLHVLVIPKKHLEGPAAVAVEDEQTVFHLHMHIIGGRSMNWPPG